MNGRSELFRRAQSYANRKGLLIGSPLGSGVHGSVFAVESQSKTGREAIKAFEREDHYCRERDVYLRLRVLQVTGIHGSVVPELRDQDDELWVIQMTVVTRPFVLDFAGAHLDRAPDFPEEVLADWRADKEEQFGSHWPEVQAILRELESYGIYMEDVSPGNIAFAD